MSRRSFPVITLVAIIAGLLVPSAAVAADDTKEPDVTLTAPKTASSDSTFGLTLNFPPEVAAFDGRVMVKDSAAEVIGLASLTGTVFRPEKATGGWYIGAYDLAAKDDRTNLDLVVAAQVPGRLQMRVVIDSASDADGNRLEIDDSNLVATVRIDGGKKALDAPAVGKHNKPTRNAAKVKDLYKDGKFDLRDINGARGLWLRARTSGAVCEAEAPGDVNVDGCTDAVDVQALVAREGDKSTAAVSGSIVLASTGAVSDAQAAAAAAPLRTFTVDSVADTPDAAPGNGTCADSLGRCTFRAALTEADWLAGEDAIAFNLVGPPPVRIQVASALPMITSRSGGVIIDGYTQPGSSPNTAQFGSNSLPGVEIRGNGTAAREIGLYITSPNNVVRGLVIGNFWRGVMIDTVNGTNNQIVGNWVGFDRLQGPAGGQYGIIPNVGANRNRIGTPALADRNVIGNWQAGIDAYGPGTDFNIIQNNVFCMRPNGATATCSTAIDHNFGPKNELIGGLGENERNYMGPTTLQAVEYSHGWNPSNRANEITWQINNNRLIGNWLGFMANGTYNAAYRSGLNASSADNAQGVNIYDGANDNIVEGNYIGSVFDGVTLQSPIANRNIVRNNIIGASPLGQAAPLTRWGIIARWGTTLDVIEGNTIRNAASGGVGLIITMNNGSATSPAFNVRISRNIVTDTTGHAIDLRGIVGPDPNDAGDGDMGANTLLNTPVITTANSTTVAGTGQNGATVEVYRASRAAGAFGLPVEYLGSTTVGSGGSWSLATAVAVGERVTALQIATDQNTSELAPNVTVQQSAPQAPAITSANSATFTIGAPGSFTVTSTGFPTPALGVTGTLPGGVTFTDNGNGTGTLAGTPAAGSGASYPLTITASNGVSPNAVQSFTLSTNVAPQITSAASTTFVAGSAGSFTVTTSGRPTPALSRTGSLPSGVTFTDNGNGTATLAGTPANGTAGSYPLTLTATNGVSPNATQNFVLTVDPPPPGAPIVQDPFNRTTVNSWGSAPTGGAYTLSGTAANFDVTGSVGTISSAAGATQAAVLTTATASNVDISMRFASDKVAAGGSQYVYAIGRRVSATTEYRASVRLAPNGAVFLHAGAVVNNAETGVGTAVQVPGLTHTAGSFIRVRVQITGTNPTTIRIRAWADGSTEPSTWQFTGTNSSASLQTAGGIGLRTYLSGATSNAPVLFSFDDLTATPLP